ncbi:GNAT family N-acetyltransferase [Helicobacter bilis]|uniref:N-acetyltransferase n=1 Tax=Helicobacter bilis TaxID=37372 RepID=A0A4V6I681_9HELI|nr:GNAT family N-acetyltransferase [Helicobacter bilis]TLE11409.1 N-acetyltransferase [Helicobacter bilis]
MAQIIREEELQGKYVNLREITLADAAFVVALRCSSKAKFLNPTKNDVGLQEQYIENYFKKNDEWYFIVEDKQGKALGTIRIYNVSGKQFEGGSWLMLESATTFQSLEGEYLLKHYAYYVLGFNKNCFEVRKANKKVVQYHKFCGSRIIGETDIDYLFELTKDEFLSNKHKLLDLMEIYAKD